MPKQIEEKQIVARLLGGGVPPKEIISFLTIEDWIKLKETSKELYDYISDYIAEAIKRFPDNINTLFDAQTISKLIQWDDRTVSADLRQNL